MYSFDIYGWLTSTVIPERQTAVVPPAQPWPAGKQPNFTGYNWQLMDYVAPPVVVPAPVVVPEYVTMRQARLALYIAGKLASVNSAVAGMVGTKGDAARIEWEFSNEVHRGSQLINDMKPVLSMTDAEVDSLFISAASL